MLLLLRNGLTGALTTTTGHLDGHALAIELRAPDRAELAAAQEALPDESRPLDDLHRSALREERR